MTINIGDRVRLREATYGVPAGSTGTVHTRDMSPSDPQVRVAWDSVGGANDLWLWAARLERIEDEGVPPVLDPTLLEPGDLLEVNRTNPTNEGILTPGTLAIVRSLDAHGSLHVEWVTASYAPPTHGGPWSPRRFTLPEIRVGHRVRSTGSDPGVPAGHLGGVESRVGEAFDVRWDTRDERRHTVTKDAIRAIDAGNYHQRVLDFTIETAGRPAENADGVQEWQKKWTDLVLAAHRIADEHDMCSSFEQNVVDLGIPPRGRHADEVDFDDEGFETPDLVIEGESENEYCVSVERTVQVTVPVTVYVTQYGHVHYTGTDGPADEGDIDWYSVEWDEIDQDNVASSLYNMSNGERRDQVHLEYVEEDTAVDGTEEIVDWEPSE